MSSLIVNTFHFHVFIFLISGNRIAFFSLKMTYVLKEFRDYIKSLPPPKDPPYTPLFSNFLIHRSC